MPGCIFCQIIAGAIPASIVFEDENLVVFLDHRPLFPGHCLLVPQQHLESLIEVPTDVLSFLSAQARQLAIAMEQGLQAQGPFSRLTIASARVCPTCIGMLCRGQRATD